MPQFVPNGPIVHDTLVQDLEDDRVVIFCGAGISMGAGLLSYHGLVEHCYEAFTHPLPAANDAEWNWPDRMLGALEIRYGAAAVRRVVGARLNKKPKSLKLHRAILRLARLRRFQGLRLVTTNFDTFFEKARRKLGLRYEWHSGPVLPIPRNDRTGSWRSLVYLHGRLGTLPTQQLILTSADFGRAYLTEGWASRFVARLFADFTVLFIGYSLNDPVLRYMTDAFAAEDAEMRLSEPRGPAYIFLPYHGDVPPPGEAYRYRNLEPIFYNATNDHLRLQETILAWADAREDYLANTTALITRIALNRPDAISPTDTANLLWAVAGREDDHGHGARVFARAGGDRDPPPIEWLDAFEQREREVREQYANAREKAERADRRPPPEPTYHFASLFQTGGSDPNLTPVAARLIPWLVRHLATRGLVERVLTKLSQGRQPHREWRHAIREALREPTDLRPGYQRFWRILAAEGRWLAGPIAPYFGPASCVRQSLGANPEPSWLTQEIVAALTPVLRLTPSTGLSQPQAGSDQLSDLATPEIDFADGQHASHMIESVNGRPGAAAFWAGMLQELTSLLRRALDLYAVADQANEAFDPSAFHRPSIVPHSQNFSHRRWTLLFDLIWQGWVHIDAATAEHARAYVAYWRQQRYLAFRRLALAAMNHSAHFSAEERMQALLDA